MSRSSSKASFSRHRPVLRAVFVRPAGHRGIRQRRCLWRVDRPDPRPRIGRRRQQLDHNRLSPARQGRQDGGSGFCCQHRGLQPDRGVLGPLDFMGWRRQRAVSILDDAGRPGCRGLVRPPSSRLINPGTPCQETPTQPARHPGGFGSQQEAPRAADPSLFASSPSAASPCPPQRGRCADPRSTDHSVQTPRVEGFRVRRLDDQRRGRVEHARVGQRSAGGAGWRACVAAPGLPSERRPGLKSRSAPTCIWPPLTLRRSASIPRQTSDPLFFWFWLCRRWPHGGQPKRTPE